MASRKERKRRHEEVTGYVMNALRPKEEDKPKLRKNLAKLRKDNERQLNEGTKW